MKREREAIIEALFYCSKTQYGRELVDSQEDLNDMEKVYEELRTNKITLVRTNELNILKENK